MDAKMMGSAAALSPASQVVKAHSANMERAGHFRTLIDRKRERGGENAGLSEALSMLVGVFGHLVEHHGIEKATTMMGNSLRDMSGQALIKRAKDIRDGKRPPMTAEDLR